MQFYLPEIIIALNDLVGIFVVFRFLNHLLDKKEINTISTNFATLSIYFFSVMVNVLVHELGASLFWGLLLFYLIGDIFYVGKRHIKLIAAIFIVVFSLITELITAVLSSIVFNTDIINIRSNPMHLFMGGIVSRILLILLVEIVIRFRVRGASRISMTSWLLIITIPMISIILALVSVYEPIASNTVSNLAIIACVSILYINIMAFYLFDNIIVQIDDNSQMRRREQLLLQQQNQYKNIIAGYTQVKKIRHDMLGHLAAIKGYIDNDHTKEAAVYIRSLHGDLDFSSQGIYSENIVIDAVINNRKAVAVDSGIEVVEEIMIPEKLKISDMDICMVLGNSLTNSIEACRRIERSEQPRIQLCLKYKNDSLLIEIKNSYNYKTIHIKKGEYISSKPFRTNSDTGNGIQNIRDVVEKYNGVLNIEQVNGWFILEAVIPDKKLDEKLENQ